MRRPSLTARPLMATRMPWCFSLVMLFSDALGSVFSEASRGVCSGGAAGLCEQLTFVSFSVTFFFLQYFTKFNLYIHIREQAV